MAASESVETQAFVTLATNDTYALGALVLAHSLRQAGTTRKIAIMITQGISDGMRNQLSEVFDCVTQVNVLDSRDTANLALLTRPDLGVTFTKFHCWRLTQYTKCVFMDADTLVLQNCDELFDREELSAAPDAGWPDCFNSGVFVYTPSDDTYQALLQFAVTSGSFDGGDQGLLNMYFSDWATKDISKHLPFIYNVVSQAFYSYLPAFRQFGKKVKVAHFIGPVKPWHHTFNTATGRVEPQAETMHHGSYLQYWWNIFMSEVQPKLDPCVERLLHLYDRLPAPPPCETYHQQMWPERSPVDYSQMESPYQVPSVDTFYEKPSEPSPTRVSPPTMIESQDDRQFTFLDSFYSEPPMATEERYPTPSGAYEAKTFHELWRDFSVPSGEEEPRAEGTESTPQEAGSISQGAEPRPQEAEPRPQEWESKHEETCISDHTAESESPMESHQEDISCQQHKQDHHISIQEGQTEAHPPPSTSRTSPRDGGQSHSPEGATTYDENRNDISNDKAATAESLADNNYLPGDSSYEYSIVGMEVEPGMNYEMGLVGGLASLKLVAGSSDYTQQQLDDRQRQYNWEQGQVDYLGIDAFQHIQRKLDQTITKPKAAAAEKPAAAPAAAAKQAPAAAPEKKTKPSGKS